MRATANARCGFKRRHVLLGAAAGGALASSPWRRAAAQLRVDVTGGRVEPLPIAVSPLAGSTDEERRLGERVADIVAADLERSGLFRVIDRGAYIQGPDELQALPRFADWRQINAQALVGGGVTEQAGVLGVEFRLWDVFAGQQLRGLRFDTTTDNLRRIAHKVADTVYERLTGEGGYFDSRIAYIAESGPATRRVKRLALMDQDGENHRFLTDGGTLVLTPRLTPDARQVAYLSYGTVQPRVLLRDLTTGRENVLADRGNMSFSPRFSPDGGTVLMTVAEEGNSDVFSLDVATGRWSRLTEGFAIDTSPSFSPNGDRIAFNSDRGGTPQLYVMNPDGSNTSRISYGVGRYFSPAWSPRGDLIAFTKIKDGFFHIGLMRPDGGDERLITRSFYDENPSFSPNGRVVMFTRERADEEGSRLYTINVSGYNERLVPTPQDASDPDWSGLIP